MRIRIYSPYFPYPPSEGAFQVIYDQVASLALLGHQIEVVCWKSNPVSGHPPLWSSEKVKISAFHPSEDQKTWRVLSSLISWEASPEKFYYPGSNPLQNGEGIGFDEVDLAIYHYSFAWKWLRKGRAKGEKKVAVYFHNLESDLFELRYKSSSGPSRCVHQLNLEKLRHHERDLSQIADSLWFISDQDLTDYLHRYPQTLKEKCRVTPPSFSKTLVEETGRKWKVFKQGHPLDQPILGFVGGLGFQPNLDSFKWILENVAPELQRQNFSGKFLVVGKNPHAELKSEIEKFPFIQMLGFQEFMDDFWTQISYLLCPHITGSGVRMKILESVARGIPVLANRSAVTRCVPAVRHSPLIRVFENPSEWVQTLLSEKAFEWREKHSDLEFNDGLDGRKIYSFLESQERH